MSDSRVKASVQDNGALAARVANGEATAQVAADYGITQRRAQQIVKAE